jgi:phosphotransferase system enzyme I (PtsI)
VTPCGAWGSAPQKQTHDVTKLVGKEMNAWKALILQDGFALAPALCLSSSSPALTSPSLTLSSPSSSLFGLDEGREQLRKACALVDAGLVERLEAMSEHLKRQDCEIFEAQRMLLEDEAIWEAFEKAVKAGARDAVEALDGALEDCVKEMLALDDALFRERVVDLRDIWGEVRRALAGGEAAKEPPLAMDVILVAQELLPSSLARFPLHHIKGLLSAKGSPHGHLAILARSLGIPYVCQAEAIPAIASGEIVILDTEKEAIIHQPDQATLAHYLARLPKKQEGAESAFVALKQPRKQAQPLRTACGEEVILLANLSLLEELALLEEAGVEGIGLFRTEWLFMRCHALPSEEEQYRWYREIVERLAPAPVVFRALDLGGDKQLSFLSLSAEQGATPFSTEQGAPSLRGMRFLLHHPAILREQFRALIRASAYGSVQIMLPMLISLEQWHIAHALYREAHEELAARGMILPLPPLGMMIETPAAALTLEDFAPHIDFASLGTNDLSRLLVDVERDDPLATELLLPTQPALLRLLHRCIQILQATPRPLTLCGEMAANPRYLPLLLGLGLRRLSVSPAHLDAVRDLIPRIELPRAQSLAQEALHLPSSASIELLCDDFLW